MYKSSNPAMRTLRRVAGDAYERQATYGGVAVKTVYFLLLAVASAIVFAIVCAVSPASSALLMVIAVVSLLISAIVSSFFPATVKVSGSIYAIAEGVLLGASSMLLDAAYSGVVVSALIATFSVLLIMMVLYFSGAVQVTNRFRFGLISALGAVLLANFAMFIIGIFSPTFYSLFYGNSVFSIGISVVMVIFASFFLLVDLYDIDYLVKNGFDKRYEWNAAFGLTLTIIWLYLEFLRLFAKYASNRR